MKLSALSIGAFVAPIVVVKCSFPRLGVFKTACVGYIVSCISILSFGLAILIKSNVWFLVLSITSRMVEGLAVSMILTSFIVLVATKFNDSDSHLTALYFGMAIA